MTTLREIEQAIELLPVDEQKQLVTAVETRLRRQLLRSRESGDEWLAHFNKQRESVRYTPQHDSDSLSILNELREDR